MNIEESITHFTKEYPVLQQEQKELNNSITSVFEKKIEEIRPIINLMLKQKLYFFHPDLSEDIKSSNGVILGRNSRNTAELYVCDGSRFIKKVDGYRDEVIDEHAIGFPAFIERCDLNFAISGIEHIRNYLPALLESFQKDNSKNKKFLETHGI